MLANSDYFFSNSNYQDNIKIKDEVSFNIGVKESNDQYKENYLDSDNYNPAENASILNSTTNKLNLLESSIKSNEEKRNSRNSDRKLILIEYNEMQIKERKNSLKITRIDNTIRVPSKLDKYEKAQKILESQKEKINKNKLNLNMNSNYLTLSPNFISRNDISPRNHFTADNIIKKPLEEKNLIKSKTERLIFNNINQIDEVGERKIVSSKEEESYFKSNVIKFDPLNLMNEDVLKIFLKHPIERGVCLKCNIERKLIEKNTFKFILKLDCSNLCLLYAIKKPKKSYKLYMNESNEQKYLGKLKSNFFGTEFNSFDDGKKPKKEIHTDLNRINLATITYEANMFGLNGPRKMRVYIPFVDSIDYKPTLIKQRCITDTIKKRFNSQIGNPQMEKDKITILINKQPIWSETNGCYLLDYKDRKIKQSVKNFQIVQTNNYHIDIPLNDEVLLQMGRTSENNYILDFKFPFSPIQAISIALSSIDNKIACE